MTLPKPLTNLLPSLLPNLLTVGLRPSSPPQVLSLRQRAIAICFGLSLLSPLYFGLISWHHAATSGTIIQDDVRLHIVWLQRWIDPELFANDIIADYYSAVQAVGFKVVYGLAAAIGIDPLALSQCLPLVLALITTVYLFWVSLRLLPVPLCGILTTLILNQNIWLKDDLISATPRAFIYPLFAAFLYYLLKGATIPWLIALGIQGLFYPQMMLVSAGILTLRLVQWKVSPLSKGGLRGVIQAWNYPKLPKRWQEYRTWAVAIGLTLAILLFFSHQVEARIGPLISAEDMRQMPEFQVNGRRQYFGVSPLKFWFSGASGLRLPLFPPIILLGALLPWVWRKKGMHSNTPDFASLTAPQPPLPTQSSRHSSQTHRIGKGDSRVHQSESLMGTRSFCPSYGSPLTVHLTSQNRILAELLLSAVGLFFLAHLLFPTLYLPSRYTFYSLRFLMAIATGIMLTLVLDRVRLWLQRRQKSHWTWGDYGKAILGAGMAIAILTVPAIPTLFLSCQGWVTGETPQIYQQLSQSPKDTLVASLDPEASNIPAFSQRSVWVSGEFAIPYHAEFYQAMLERMESLVKAQYSPDMEMVRSLIQTHGIDRWLIHKNFADPDYLSNQDWLLNSAIQPIVLETSQKLVQGTQPAILSHIPACTIVEENELILLDAHCLE